VNFGPHFATRRTSGDFSKGRAERMIVRDEIASHGEISSSWFDVLSVGEQCPQVAT